MVAFLQIQSANATAETLPSVCVASQGLQTDPPAPSASERRTEREGGKNMKEDCKEIEIKMGQRAGDGEVCHNTHTLTLTQSIKLSAFLYFQKKTFCLSTSCFPHVEQQKKKRKKLPPQG